MNKMYKPQWIQAMVALALALGAALVVNWAILKLFGQKSPYRAEHSLSSEPPEIHRTSP